MYIDAGTGSLLLQAGMAAVFSAMIFGKRIVGHLRTGFRKTPRA